MKPMKTTPLSLASVALVVGALILVVILAGKHPKRNLASRARNIKIVTEKRPTCDLGELDVIDMDQYYRGTTERFIFTIEPMEGADTTTPPVVKEVTASALLAGMAFTLPAPAASQKLGLFLCSDADSKGSCRGKPLVPPSAVVVQNTEASLKNPTYHPPDRIFFARLLNPPSAVNGEDMQVALYRHEGKCP